MDYASGGSLFNYVRQRGRLQEPFARWCFQQLILGLDYCHRKARPITSMHRRPARHPISAPPMSPRVRLPAPNVDARTRAPTPTPTSHPYPCVQGVANRDLKLENTLLDFPQAGVQRPLVKICDFGWGRRPRRHARAPGQGRERGVARA